MEKAINACYQFLISLLKTDSHLLFRKAQKEDVDILFKWANDPKVRAQSLSSDSITYEDHTKWFTGKLSNVNCFLYIAIKNDIPVGMIRFDVNNNESTISYLVDEAERGKGTGSAIISEGIEKFILQSGFHGKMLAVVKVFNTPSIKIFEKFKFEKENINKDLIRFKRPV